VSGKLHSPAASSPGPLDKRVVEWTSQSVWTSRRREKNPCLETYSYSSAPSL